MRVHRYALIIFLAACAGCTDYSTEISDHFDATGRTSIDLAKAAPIKWERVCFVDPYSLDTDVERTIGFKWPAERLTNIEDGDAVALLLFVENKSVIEHVEYPRDQGDFAGLGGRCFEAADAKFRIVSDSRRNWAHLVPESEA